MVTGSPHRIRIAATLLLLLAPMPARAEDDGGQNSRREYAAGWQALERGDYRTALAHYRKSYRLLPRPRTLFNMATCEERLGDVEAAKRHYREFVKAAEARDSEFRAQALTRLASLEARNKPPSAHTAQAEPMPRAEIDDRPRRDPRPVQPTQSADSTPRTGHDPASNPEHGSLCVRTGASSAQISLDGLVVGSSRSERGDHGLCIKVPPGPHILFAEERAGAIYRQSLEVAARESIELHIEFRSDAPGRSRALRWTILGASTAALALGGLFGLQSLDAVRSNDPERHDRGKSLARVTDVLLLSGGLGLAGSWALSRHAQPRARIMREQEHLEVAQRQSP